MNWLNIRLSSLRAPEYIGSDPTARATWWNVVAYCAEQENGGKIIGARNWKCRQWQQTCGVMLVEVDASEKLLTWNGDDLIVWNYPVEKEEEIRVKREAGKVGGGRSAKVRAKHTLKKNGSTASSSASISASTEGEGEGEGKEKKKARGGIFDSLPADLDTAEFREAWTKYVEYRKRRKIDPLLPESVEMQWKKMKKWGVLAASAQIEDTIASGWQGVFAPKAGSVAPSAPVIRAPIAYDGPRGGL